MPETTGRNRYWGSQEPSELAPIVDMAASTDTAATMRIYGPVDDWGAPFGISADEFGTALASLGDVKTINLHIHSPGGAAFEGTAIKNQLQQHPATVNVIVDGLAASAASMIAMAGDTVTMAPSAQMMVHDASALVVGQSSDMQTMAARLESVSQSYAQAYAAKAGGSVADWRAAMQPETWFTAAEAVEAGLADKVMPKPKKPAAPKANFDLSIFAHAGRDDAPAPVMPAKASTNPPAEPPVSTNPKEKDTMSDTIIKGLRERLGIADDVVMDDEAVLAKYDELTAEAAAALATASAAPEPKEPEIPAGKVLVSETLLAELKDGAAAGIEARGKQRAEERDTAINAAFTQGKISADRKAAWAKAWDADAEGTKADLASLEVRFPVAATVGYQGSDGTDGVGVAPFDDDEATAMAELTGAPKEAFLA